MGEFKDYFRDMESVGEEQRKSAILLALIASLEDHTQPKQADRKKFSELFIPLFEAATKDTQRKSVSALSRIANVPGNVAEFISLQPLDISAPFLSHSPSLSDPILCYVIACKDEAYAKLIAKRNDLHQRVVRSLLAVNDPGVNRALHLRGYITELNDQSIEPVYAEIDMNWSFEKKAKAVKPGHVEFFDTSEPEISTEGGIFSVEAYEAKMNTQPDTGTSEESLRQTLKQLVSEISTPLDPEQLLAAQDAAHKNDGLSDIVLPILSGELTHRKHVAILKKHIENNHLDYFTTGLADAMGASYHLAERIMSDMSGRQLALFFTAVLMPADICIAALNKFFPHVSMMEGTDQGADSMMQQLQHGDSLQKLLLWIKADKMSNGEIDIELSEADIDYRSIDIDDMPYREPIADNNDVPLEEFEEQPWVKRR